MFFVSYFRNIRRGVQARQAAEKLCAGLHPHEPFQGSWVCADESARFVVRVFYGVRERSKYLGPPWRECLIVAVDKGTFAAEPVSDDGPYRPTLR